MEKIIIKIDKTGVNVTEAGPDGKPVTRNVTLGKNEALTVTFIEKCMRAGFDLKVAFTEISSAFSSIFTLGYIPADDEFYELTPEQYQKYYVECEKTNERIYMLLPKDPRYQKTGKEVDVLTEEQIGWFDKAKKIMKQYRRDYNKEFDTIEDELAWLVTVMPADFSSGTKTRRNLLHLVKNTPS
jgi:hypothetical protein